MIMSPTTLTISSKSYSSWSLRAWFLMKMSGLPFVEQLVPPDPPDARSEILLLKDCSVVPCLHHDGMEVWDTLAIAEFLNELKPAANMLPDDRTARAHCRSISSEMHSGFCTMRAELPMNLKAHFPNYPIWIRARADIDRILAIWGDCLQKYGGPYLFGAHLTVADAMYAPVVTRIQTYDVKIDATSAEYCRQILALPLMQEWIAAAKLEPEIPDVLAV
jgi:glutathione S-transferase